MNRIYFHSLSPKLIAEYRAELNTYQLTRSFTDVPRVLLLLLFDCRIFYNISIDFLILAILLLLLLLILLIHQHQVCLFMCKIGIECSQ